MDLVFGRQYKKTNFNIEGISLKLSELVVAGELFTFFTMTGEYRNEIQDDGFVYECRANYSLIPHRIKTSLKRYVFVRKAKDEDYTCLGQGLYEARYDDTRNKIFFGQNNIIERLAVEG